MKSLIGLVNRIQMACTALGDYGGANNSFSSLWDELPSVAVVGGQVPQFSTIMPHVIILDMFYLTQNLKKKMSFKIYGLKYYLIICGVKDHFTKVKSVILRLNCFLLWRRVFLIQSKLTKKDNFY